MTIRNKQSYVCDHCKSTGRCHRILATAFIEEIIEHERRTLQETLTRTYMSDPFFDSGEYEKVNFDTDTERSKISLEYYKKRKRCTERYVEWKVEKLKQYRKDIPLCFLIRLREIFPDPNDNYCKDEEYIPRNWHT